MMSLAVELAPKVRVNLVSPGWVRTPMAEEALQRIGPALTATLPNRRVAEVDDVVNAALWLLSDASSHCIGQDLCVSGGALPVVLDALALAAEHGFALPVVWNCGGYESVEALRLLDGVVDVYLPDAKYGDDAAAYELSGCKRYTAALRDSLQEMHRQAMVIVRHLVLPAGVAAPEKLMPRIA